MTAATANGFIEVQGPLLYLWAPTSDGRTIARVRVDLGRSVPVYRPASAPDAIPGTTIGRLVAIDAQRYGLAGTLSVRRDAWDELRGGPGRRSAARAAVDLADVETTATAEGIVMDGRLAAVTLMDALTCEPTWPGDTLMWEVTR